MQRILLQLDTDPQPSVFDRVVAVDADVEQLFSYGAVTVDNVTPLIHGTMFTRGLGELNHTAVFVGGSDVSAGEALLAQVQKTFFGPVRVSVMLDSNGSNTTAAAAVLTASRHLSLGGCAVTVLGATGPVGQRVAQLLASEGAIVRVCSRDLGKANVLCKRLSSLVRNAAVDPRATSNQPETEAACQGAQLIIAAGAAGVELLPLSIRKKITTLKVAIDLNAVPPVGISGIEVPDRAIFREGVTCYGAVGVGGLKMKIHKAAVRQLFESNDQVLDTQAIYELGKSLV